MKKNTISFRHISPLAARLLLIISLMGFNCSAIAGKLITNKQILQVAKIAKDTGTHIKIYKEATTVNIYGNRNKKTDKKIKNRVYKILTQKYKTSNFDVSPSTSYSSSKRPPELEGQAFHPPVLEGKAVKPPVLEDRSPPGPPVLEVPAIPSPSGINNTGNTDKPFY